MIGICDIKRRSKSKKEVYSSTSPTSTQNHNENDPIQEYHEEYDKDVVHSESSIETAHLLLDSNYSQAHCAPTQSLPEEKPTSSPPLPHEYHPSEPSNGILSKTSPWITSPNIIVSLESEASIAGMRVDSPSMTMFGMTSGKNNGSMNGINPAAVGGRGAE